MCPTSSTPRTVAQYAVPEGGSHNMWVEDDVLYMGYYSAGARVLDVSGELRGDLYRQGREIARLWTGDPKGYRPNQPFTWGAQPHDGLDLLQRHQLGRLDHAIEGRCRQGCREYGAVARQSPRPCTCLGKAGSGVRPAGADPSPGHDDRARTAPPWVRPTARVVLTIRSSRLFAGIVLRVDVVDAPGSGAVELDDGFLSGPREVPHVPVS